MAPPTMTRLPGDVTDEGRTGALVEGVGYVEVLPEAGAVLGQEAAVTRAAGESLMRGSELADDLQALLAG
ncbi:hypothetical protein VE00_10008 [Pseudogymnoascus sp. WSF 3629]|nr:hypothetical protein VE00_10008 [Pseudogymnoascus sp. WSF 3629]